MRTFNYRGVPSPFVYVSLTLRCCCGGVAGGGLELVLTNGMWRVSGDMIIAREGESVCVALWPDEAGAGAVDEEEGEDEVGGSEAGGCGGVGTGSSAAGVWRLYDGLPYGDA